ncbi:NAD(P)H-dependent glycerol-3-phosphate dehydrogenase [candidate division GN15 bacterium]|nr:NAD(P)H-dependent glycerol-3-phosphate dehydrogenase [candidate division GN15 bacterium]
MSEQNSRRTDRMAILGAGSWGMAIASLLHQQVDRLQLWEYSLEDYQRLVDTRGNPGRLTDFRLPESIGVTNNLAEAVTDADVIVLAVPSQYLRSVVQKIPRELSHAPVVVNLAKGIENGSLKRMSEILLDETSLSPEQVGTLSGPSHAEEVVLDMPTTIVAASPSAELAQRLQQLFSVGNLRVYMSDDIVGVELGGSLKNIIAIAAGIADGLGLGDNTKGALMTRGLAEITRLGVAMGARMETFAGLSGVGDLVTTCFSRHSRNRFVGEQIGKGRRLDEILQSMTMVAEGIQTTRSGLELARVHGVEVPITEQVHEVLFKGKSPAEAVGDLMERKLRAEVWQ